MSFTIDSLFSANILRVVAAAADEPAANPILSFLPLVLIFAAMYFLLLRPQRKRQKENANLQKSIAEGDEVVLNSGIYGFVSAVEDEWLWLDMPTRSRFASPRAQSPAKSRRIRSLPSEFLRYSRQIDQK